MSDSQRILITGANGYVGRLLLQQLSEQSADVCGIDIRCDDAVADVTQMDIRDDKLVELLQERNITHVVHLASIVQPGKDEAREYDIDVNGTQNVLDSCLAAGVRHLTVTSSGAAYGYHADNPEWLTELHPLRGNDEFSYSRHKRLVEEMLQQYRQSHPQLQQLVLRPGSVLGDTPPNMITRLFTGKFHLGLRGFKSPFVFIWDRDLVNVLAQGVTNSTTGQFNVAGDGCLSIQEISNVTGMPVLNLPVWLIKAALYVARPLGLTPFGPQQVRFMQYRPVLANDRLKSEFGYTPQRTSREVLEYFVSLRAGQE